MCESKEVGWIDRMDARNQARAEQDNVRMSNENWERRIREQEAGSGRRFAMFVLCGAAAGFLVGLAKRATTCSESPSSNWARPEHYVRFWGCPVRPPGLRARAQTHPGRQFEVAGVRRSVSVHPG